ncbi:MAG: hypothetical protein K8S54_16610 [Spirochaetia bacterium]|nr:hypothetical protein [Spirochaetia bacterium]
MERNVVTGIAFSVFAIMAFFLFKKVSNEERGILAFKDRSAFSTNSFFDSRLDPLAVVDGNPDTAWIESMPGQSNCIRGETVTTRADERPDCLFIQIDLGFSHRPHVNQPEKNPLESLEIRNPGNAYSRPKQVRLVFFLQEVVDIDRELRLPTLPQFWTSREIVLADTASNNVSLDFLPTLEDTAVYPGKVKRIWMRMEIESVYPASSSAVAISELSYKNKKGSVVQ